MLIRGIRESPIPDFSRMGLSYPKKWTNIFSPATLLDILFTPFSVLARFQAGFILAFRTRRDFPWTQIPKIFSLRRIFRIRKPPTIPDFSRIGGFLMRGAFLPDLFIQFETCHNCTEIAWNNKNNEIRKASDQFLLTRRAWN
jgi:hypothetical protein